MRKPNALYRGALLLTIFGCLHCKNQAPPPASNPSGVSSGNTPYLTVNGKRWDKTSQKELYRPFSLDSISLPLIHSDIAKALRAQIKLLDYTRTDAYLLGDHLEVNKLQLFQTIRLLLDWQQTFPLGLQDNLQIYRIQGEDQRGNVRFTGYYSPVVPVSDQPDAEYRYPLYSRPRRWEGPLPDRQAIEAGGVLDSQGLELAYARNKVDIYLMQIQGSGLVEYRNGKRTYFAYDGTNLHPYRNIENYLRSWTGPQPKSFTIDGIKQFFEVFPHLVDSVLFYNPSYTFFTPSKGSPLGAGSVPLTPQVSIAVDRRFIPLGSCLLAAMPIYDHQKKRVTGHEYRLMMAQDVGGAIRGPGHVDVYLGIGPEAREAAGSLHHYGQVFLILPK